MEVRNCSLEQTNRGFLEFFVFPHSQVTVTKQRFKYLTDERSTLYNLLCHFHNHVEKLTVFTTVVTSRISMKSTNSYTSGDAKYCLPSCTKIPSGSGIVKRNPRKFAYQIVPHLDISTKCGANWIGKCVQTRYPKTITDVTCLQQCQMPTVGTGIPTIQPIVHFW